MGRGQERGIFLLPSLPPLSISLIPTPLVVLSTLPNLLLLLKSKMVAIGLVQNNMPHCRLVIDTGKVV